MTRRRREGARRGDRGLQEDGYVLIRDQRTEDRDQRRLRHRGGALSAGRGRNRERDGRLQRNPQQDQERAEHAQDHQGDGDGRGLEDEEGAGPHARRAPVRRARVQHRDAHREGEHRVPASVPAQARRREARRRRSSSRPTRACAAASTPTCCASCCSSSRNGAARASTSTSSRSATRASASCSAWAATSCRASCSSATARTSTGSSAPVKVLIDEYLDGKVDEIHIFYTNFVNTMKQEPRHGRIVPIPEEYRTAAGEVAHVADFATARGTTSTSPTRASCSTA